MPLPEQIKRHIEGGLRKKLEHRDIALEQFRDYANGDQWGTGRYWTGRKPKDGGMEAVKKLFVQDDQIGGCLDRLVSSVLRNEPEWLLRSVADDDAEVAEYAPYAAALAQWFTASDAHDIITKAFRAACWAGSSYLRVYIPDTYAEYALEGSVPLERAFSMIRLQALDPLSARAIRDEHGMIVGYWYAYTEYEGEQERAMLEVHTPEMVYHCTRDALEVVREAPNPLYDAERFGEQDFLILEMARQRGVPVFGAGTIDKQNALNRELTHMNRNGELAGYRTIVLKNAYTPEKQRQFEEAMEGQALRVGKSEPPPWAFGADTILDVMSTIHDNITVLPVDVDTIEPVRADLFFEPTIAMYRQSILDDFSQGFVQGVQKAVSGESKRESRDAFNKLVELEARMVEQALRGVLEDVLRLALALSGGSISVPWKIVANVKTDIARTTLEEYEVQMRGYESGTNSLRVAVSSNPMVGDVEAELQRIAEGQKQRELLEQAKTEARLQEAEDAGLFSS